MEGTAITRFLDNVMDTPSVSGAILVDARSGLCLGAAGQACEDDAPQITVAARAACDSDGVGLLMLRGVRVLVRRGEDVLVGVFKEG